jgi:hypothetical protein
MSPAARTCAVISSTCIRGHLQRPLVAADFEIDAENGAADEWLHNEIVRRAVARFGKTVVLTVIDTDGSTRRYPLLSFVSDLALYGACGKMRVAFGPPRTG